MTKTANIHSVPPFHLPKPLTLEPKLCTGVASQIFAQWTHNLDTPARLRQFVVQGASANPKTTKIFTETLDDDQTEALIAVGIAKFKKWEESPLAKRDLGDLLVWSTELGLDPDNPAHDDAVVALATRIGPALNLGIFLGAHDRIRGGQLVKRIIMSWIECEMYRNGGTSGSITLNPSRIQHRVRSWSCWEFPQDLLMEILSDIVTLLEKEDRRTQKNWLQPIIEGLAFFAPDTQKPKDQRVLLRLATLAYRYQLVKDLDLFDIFELDPENEAVKQLFNETYLQCPDSFLAAPLKYGKFLIGSAVGAVQEAHERMAGPMDPEVLKGMGKENERVLFEDLVVAGHPCQLIKLLSHPPILQHFLNFRHKGAPLQEILQGRMRDIRLSGWLNQDKLVKMIVEEQIEPLLAADDGLESSALALAEAFRNLHLWLAKPSNLGEYQYFGAQILYAAKYGRTDSGYGGVYLDDTPLPHHLLKALPQVIDSLKDPKWLKDLAANYPDYVAAAFPFAASVMDQEMFLNTAGRVAQLSVVDTKETRELWEWLSAFCLKCFQAKPFKEEARELLRYCFKKGIHEKDEREVTINWLRYIFRQLTLASVDDSVLSPLKTEKIFVQQLRREADLAGVEQQLIQAAEQGTLIEGFSVARTKEGDFLLKSKMRDLLDADAPFEWMMGAYWIDRVTLNPASASKILFFDVDEPGILYQVITNLKPVALARMFMSEHFHLSERSLISDSMSHFGCRKITKAVTKALHALLNEADHDLANSPFGKKLKTWVDEVTEEMGERSFQVKKLSAMFSLVYESVYREPICSLLNTKKTSDLILETGNYLVDEPNIGIEACATYIQKIKKALPVEKGWEDEEWAENRARLLEIYPHLKGALRLLYRLLQRTPDKREKYLATLNQWCHHLPGKTGSPLWLKLLGFACDHPRAGHELSLVIKEGKKKLIELGLDTLKWESNRLKFAAELDKTLNVEKCAL